MSSTSRRILVLLLLAFALPAQAARYEIRPGADDNEVRFLSKATMESFEGQTDQVSGFVEADLADLSQLSRWRIEVDLASLDTGIGLRNRHMRDNHLETEEFPTAVFEGGKVSGVASVAVGAKTTLQVEGEFSLHGVTKPRVIDVELSPREDGGIDLRAQLDVSLAEHEIKRPKFLIMKLADVQKVTLELRLVPAPAGDSR